MVLQPIYVIVCRKLTIATVLHKLNVINDHVAEDKEDFDINLYPTHYQKSEPDTASVKSVPPISRAPTRTSIVDSLWSRKASTAPQNDTGNNLQRSNTWRSDLTRTDSVVEGAALEEGALDRTRRQMSILELTYRQKASHGVKA